VSSRSTSSSASTTDRRQTSGTPRFSSSAGAFVRRSSPSGTRSLHWVRMPKTRFLAEVRRRTRCIRRASRSCSSRSSSEGIRTAGTRSRLASSASTRASTLSVFAASGATALTLRQSATSTRQPQASSRSRTQAAPLIISRQACTSGPSLATSFISPSTSAGTSPRRRARHQLASRTTRRADTPNPVRHSPCEGLPSQSSGRSTTLIPAPRRPSFMTFHRSPPAPPSTRHRFLPTARGTSAGRWPTLLGAEDLRVRHLRGLPDECDAVSLRCAPPEHDRRMRRVRPMESQFVDE
jgi:hypothetical protein